MDGKVASLAAFPALAGEKQNVRKDDSSRFAEGPGR
jgi:hypothetical protein